MQKECRLTAAAGFEGLTIDVSSNNGAIDWQKVKAAGVHTAILRATMGGAGVDTRFAEYNAAAARAGVATGFYHLFRPDSDGIPQARHFLRSTEGSAEGVYGELLAVDVERVVSPQRELTKAQYADELKAFLEYLNQETNTPIYVYTSAGEWAALVGTQHDAYFGRFSLWVANYSSAPQPVLPRCWSSYALWQYTSVGRVAGIVGDVDLNRPARGGGNVNTERRFLVPADFPHVMSSGFDAPRDYPFAPNRKQLHEGADFAPKKNVAKPPYRVVAPADGEVVKVGFDAKGYGNYLIIDHGDGFRSWLAHLEAPPLVKSGGVGIGQLVGYAGSTGGTSTGVHLHWSLQYEGRGASNYVLPEVVDPLLYIMT